MKSHGERPEPSTLARLQDEVIGALAERVEVETVAEHPSDLVFITIRLPEGITEQARLATEEWVQLRLIALEDAQAPAEHVFVARYV
jgi:AmiR/NasT family two-component response regulator